MRNGLIENLSMSDYQTDSAYSSSDIVSISESAARWRFQKEQPKEKTRALVVGSAIHEMVQAKIAGLKDTCNVLVYTEGSSLTKGFKKYQEENPNFAVVDDDEMNLLYRMREAIFDEPEAVNYLKDSMIEPSFFIEDPEFKFIRKCRPDFLHLKKGILMNIKSTLDISEKGWFRSISDYGYDFKTVNYQDILKLHYGRKFIEIHIMVDKPKEGPCRVAIRAIDDDTLDQARFQMRSVFEKIKKCEASGKWEDPKATLITSPVPAWARTVVEL
jgi:PDDEXK-like domain of unknown function (DUF3799)